MGWEYIRKRFILSKISYREVEQNQKIELLISFIQEPQPLQFVCPPETIATLPSMVQLKNIHVEVVVVVVLGVVLVAKVRKRRKTRRKTKVDSNNTNNNCDTG